MKPAVCAQAKSVLSATHVVDQQGEPQVVYRGEHGTREQGAAGFQTALPSLSFGSLEAARTYSRSPNNKHLGGGALSPRVHAVCLDIRKPLLTSDKTDQFIDVSTLIEHFGVSEATRFVLKNEGYVENTNNWYELAEQYDLSCVSDLVDRHPQLLGSLYFELYVLLDDPGFIALAKNTGFDGAIYGGSGANALETEYRVFSHEQVICPASGTVYSPIFRKPERPLTREAANEFSL